MPQNPHLYTDEHRRKMARERKPIQHYLDINWGNNHKQRIPSLRWMTDDVADLIGQHDVENEQRLIPNIGIEYDPFNAIEGHWDIQDVEDYSVLRNINVWHRVEKFKPQISYLFKHQNPNVQVLSETLQVKAKYNTLHSYNSPYIRKVMNIMKGTNWDHSKLWRIYGVAFPIGHKTVYNHYFDGASLSYYSKDFTFGLERSRVHYALFDTKVGRFCHPTYDTHNEVQYKDNPVFAPHTAIRFIRSVFRQGLTEDYLRDNVIVVRYHFHPFVSIKFDSRYSGIRKNDARTYYNNVNKDIRFYNFHAFRYHCKQVEKLKRKI